MVVTGGDKSTIAIIARQSELDHNPHWQHNFGNKTSLLEVPFEPDLVCLSGLMLKFSMEKVVDSHLATIGQSARCLYVLR